MTFLLAMLLALTQGVAEFLPISSSGHLSLIQILSGCEVPILYDVMLHFGTMISIIIVFRRDIADMLRVIGGVFSGSARKKQKKSTAGRLLFLLIVGSIPLILAVFLSDAVESLMQEPLYIGLALCVTGLLLFFADSLRRGHKTEKDATVTDSLFVGLCQGLAIVPGLSRSGMTITAGLTRRFDRGFAARFSLLLSLPAVLGATVVAVVKAVKENLDFSQLPLYLLGMVVTAVVGCFAIGLLRRLVEKERFGAFVYYCLGLGVITIIAKLMFD